MMRLELTTIIYKESITHDQQSRDPLTKHKLINLG